VAPIIDAWLEQDKPRPRKQRHTGQRIHERLCEEYGFQGSVSAVRRYIRHRKRTTAEVFYPLVFEPGEEGQVDWGEAVAVIGGVERKVFLFCMRLCHSTASFVRAYERENQESLLDGHVRSYEFFGAVPRRQAYDNLKSVVITVLKGQERILTAKFRELRCHYLFDVRFCNVRAGNEKGHVENLVKHSQRTFMTPLPEAADLKALNAKLLEACRKDLDRVVRGGPETRRELLEEEKRFFLPIPPDPFEACKEVSVTATKQSLVRFKTNDYSVPVEYAHHPVILKGFVDRVRIYYEGEVVADHRRSYKNREYILDPYHYLPLLERKPGGIHNGRPFKGEPWGEDFAEMRRELEYRYKQDGTKKYIRILLFFNTFPVKAVKRAVKLCVKYQAFSDEAVHSTLLYVPRRKMPSLDLSHRPELCLAGDGVRPASTYDRLLTKEARP
jgi:transposase